MAPSFYSLAGGLNDQDDPRLLEPGDLSTAIGCEYRIGAVASVFATGMRASAGTFGSAAHWGMAYAQYDVAASKLIVGSGTGLYEATVATSAMTGTAVTIDSSYLITAATNATPIVYTTGAITHGFANGATVTVRGVAGNTAANITGVVANATTTTFELVGSAGNGAYTSGGLVTGPNPLVFESTPTTMVARQQFERLYLASGIGVIQRIASATVTRRQNLIRKSNGTWILQSMMPPVVTPTVAAQALTTATTLYPTADTGAWLNPTKAEDTSDETKATASLSAAGTVTHTWIFPAGTYTGYKLKILHKGGAVSAAGEAIDVGVGGSDRNAIVARLKITIATNSNASGVGTFGTTLFDKAIPYAKKWSDLAIPAGTYTPASSTGLAVKAVLTYTSGSATANGLAFTIKAVAGPAVYPSAPLGFRYVVTEWDDVNKKESAFSPQSDPVTLNGSSNNGVLVTYDADAAGTLQNNRTTHWRVYRQPEGAALDEFDKYGMLAELPVDQDSFLDVFDKPLTEVARPVLRTLAVGQGDDVQFKALDLPVPLASSIDFFKGSMVLVPVDDPSNVYYTPAYDEENRPDLYAIPSRSPRNDRPLAVRTCDNVWLVFFKNWVRRIEGIPLVINGLFDAANYADASTTRGIVGPLAVDNITNLSREEDGNIWLVVADDEGVYLTNGTIFRPWSENLNWPNRIALAQTAKIHVATHSKKRRVEVYVPLTGASAITGRIDWHYGSMREDGQPKILGPHPSVARGVASAVLSGVEQRFTASSGVAVAGGVFLEDSGFSDASQAYNASGHVPRQMATGDYPIAGLGEDGYCRMVSLRTSRGAYATIAETVSMKNSSGETFTATNTYDPAAPSSCGVMADTETVRWAGDDTGTTEKAEILGYYIELAHGGHEGSALRSGYGATAATTALPI